MPWSTSPDVNVTNATIPVAGDVNATIENASIPVTGEVTATINGTTDVNITNSEVTVGGTIEGGGGYILPGDEIPIYQAGTLNGATAFTIPANGKSYPVGGADVSSFQSYDISLLLTCATQGTAGAPLACQVRLTWFNDDTSGIPVYVETWYPWVVNALATDSTVSVAMGSGEMHGRYLNVSISNGGSQPIAVQFMEVYGSARTKGVSTWNQNVATDPKFGFPDAHVGTANSGVGSDCNLYDMYAILGANTKYIFPFNLYSGNVNYYFHSTEALTLDPVIIDIGSNYTEFLAGSIPFGGTSPGALQILANTTNGQNGALLLPQSACALVVETGATAPNLQIKVTATNQ